MIRSLVLLLAVGALCAAEAPAANNGFDVTAEIFGWPMIPLWICSFLLVGMAIERWRSLRPEGVLDQPMLDAVAALAAEGRLEEARARAAASSSVVGRAWVQGFTEHSAAGVPLAEALTDATALALKPLKRNLNGIATIAVICPLFGLLGTVVGMIMCFAQIGSAGGADKAAIAGGIAFALVKTAGGLVVAIPAIVLGRFFRGRLVALAEQAEVAVARVASRWQHHRSGVAPATPLPAAVERVSTPVAALAGA